MAEDLSSHRSRAVRARAESHQLRSYIGTPLLAGDGTRLDRSCAWSTAPTRDNARLRAAVTQQARFLSHTLTRQLDRNHAQHLQDWSASTSGRDALTELVDPDAFELLLQREDARSRELADAATITVIDLPAASSRSIKRFGRDLTGTLTTVNGIPNTSAAASRTAASRTATAVAARTGSTEFTVLSTTAPATTVGALTHRRISELAAAVPHSRTSSAHRRGTMALSAVWAAARADLPARP